MDFRKDCEGDMIMFSKKVNTTYSLDDLSTNKSVEIVFHGEYVWIGNMRFTLQDLSDLIREGMSKRVTV